MLGGPHLVLADAGDDDGFAVGGVGQFLEHLLGEEGVGFADEEGGVFGAEVVRFPDPVQVDVGFHPGEEGAEGGLEVAHYRGVGEDVFVEFGGVDVAMDDFGVGGEVGEASGDAVVEAGAEGDDEVGAVDGQAGVGHAVHTGHTEVEHMVGG